MKEVEQAIAKAISKTGLLVKEFTVAPRFKSKTSSASHEWFIEFDEIQIDIKQFANEIDKELQRQNKYYKDLIVGKIIDKPIHQKFCSFMLWLATSVRGLQIISSARLSCAEFIKTIYATKAQLSRQKLSSRNSHCTIASMLRIYRNGSF